jgi:rubrerythrin
MYKLKSEIIGQIQHYHEQVFELYSGLYRKIKDPKVKILLKELCSQEKQREKYLEKHKNIAIVKDCWLAYPPNTMSNQISDCLKNVDTKENISLNELAKIELHFDECLYKLYEKLAIEEKSKRSLSNVFSYMMKRTKQHERNLSKDVNWLYDL